ncbi:MAG: SRPBCC family protein [Chitinophagaceae bacterium]
MRILKKVLSWLLILILLVAVIGLFLPRKVHIERSATVNASPTAVYNLVNDLKTYDKWMPWNKLDAKWKVEYGPQTTGTGAWYKWESTNKNVGKGQLTIDESVPGNKVVTRLNFEGFDTPAMGGYIMKPDGGKTNLTWYMDTDMGANPFSHWMGLFMGKLMGPQFDKGLADIAAMADRGELK